MDTFVDDFRLILIDGLINGQLADRLQYRCELCGGNPSVHVLDPVIAPGDTPRFFWASRTLIRPARGPARVLSSSSGVRAAMYSPASLRPSRTSPRESSASPLASA